MFAGERHGQMLPRPRHLPGENPRISVALQPHQQLNLHKVALRVRRSPVRVPEKDKYIDVPGDGHDLLQPGASALHCRGAERKDDLPRHARRLLMLNF